MAEPQIKPAMEGPLVALRSWLLTQALLAAPVPVTARGFIERLVEAGLPLWRIHLAVTTLDPQMESLGLTWTRAGGLELEGFEHGAFAKISRGSPLYDAVIQARENAAHPAGREPNDVLTVIRYRLERGEGLARYPMLVEFRGEGARDYLVLVIPFSRDGTLFPVRTGAVVTMATDRPGGFTFEEISAIRDLMPSFGAALRIGIDLSAMRTVLDTYLGGDVGRRVLSGEIRRGSVETISAAIVFGDLRGFTVLADEVPRDQLVAMLNDYLECLVVPIETHGGQVLKFLGDGLLATFAFAERDPPAVCSRALAAAVEALQRIAELNGRRRDARLPEMALDLALHLGDVLYGNVGSDRRLDFTVIGPAVNEASRLEALCAKLAVPLVASRPFVEALAEPGRFRSLGEQRLRGVRRPVEVFALA